MSKVVTRPLRKIPPITLSITAAAATALMGAGVAHVTENTRSTAPVTLAADIIPLEDSAALPPVSTDGNHRVIIRCGTGHPKHVVIIRDRWHGGIPRPLCPTR